MRLKVKVDAYAEDGSLSASPRCSVVDVATGEELERVASISFSIDAKTMVPVLKLAIYGFEAELEAPVEPCEILKL